MNGPTHKLVAGAAIFVAMANEEQKSQKPPTARPILGGVVGALSASLPDLIEPATTPNHRQFFHSILFGAVVGACLYELHKWKPDDELQRLVKLILNCAGAAYLLHLLADATTKKSLPLVGRL